MHPVLIKFGPLSVYSYGTMLAIGFSIAVLFIYSRAPSFRLDKNTIVDLSIFALIGGIIGARLFYIVLNINYYIAQPIEVFNLSKGGLVWYGGFLGGSASSIWYIRKKALNFWDVFDLMAPYVALAQAIGRIGCFLNGCCFGREGHPAQLYSSLTLILIFVALRLWQERRHFNGEIFLGYSALYSAKRFVIEFFRGDSQRLTFDLTLYQYISLAIFLTSVFIFIVKAAKWRRAI